MRVRLGAERALDDPPELLRGRRLGLVVNPASTDASLRHVADRFGAHSELRLAALFGPQHGIRGNDQDNMVEWEGGVDARTGLPVYSLYGRVRRPRPEWLRELDALVFDLPDVGVRVYTFLSTLVECMRACAEAGIPVVVLDRPNPIGGEAVEGAVLDMAFSSFVGILPIPMRHGMTLGELGLFARDALGIRAEVEVVRMEGWRRSMLWEETGLPWVMPSPNMPTPDTAAVYPGMVMLEGTLLSEGRGTTRPFEIFGAPRLDAYAYAEALASERLPGCAFRPLYFTPTFQKHAGALCGGVQAHVSDRRALPAFRLGVAAMRAARLLAPEEKLWRDPPYEYEAEKLPIDILAGGETLRRMVDAGAPIAEIEATWAPGLDRFRKDREPYLLYP